MVKIRVLQIGAENFGRGGRSIISWNLTEHLSSNYQVDFLSRHKIVDESYYEKIEKRNAQIIEPKYKINKGILGKMRDILYLRKLIKKQKYHIIHMNVDNMLEVFKAMVYVGFNGNYKYVLHGHTTAKPNERESKLYISSIRILRKIYSGKKYIQVACSDLAAKYLFGRSRNVHILKNGINIENYSYDLEIRKKIRNLLGIENKELIVGTVGRFSKPKNPFFIVNIIKELVKINSDVKFVWAGSGELFEEINNLINKYNLHNNVILLGNREDVSEIFQSLDVFILPSLYEGFGIVNLEAQASGLPCLISDGVPEEVKVNDNVYFYSLEKSAFDWAKKILEISSRDERTDKTSNLREAGYDIVSSSKELENLYNQLLEK